MVTWPCAALGRGHVAHGVCGPSWHTTWHMCRHCVLMCAKRERSYWADENVNSLVGVYVTSCLIGMIDYSVPEASVTEPAAPVEEEPEAASRRLSLTISCSVKAMAKDVGVEARVP